MQGTERAPVEFAAYKAMIKHAWGPISDARQMYDYVSPAWLTSFDNFYRDVGECPPGCQLVKIDSAKRWEKGNAQWA
jgi:hypothetical protein